MAKAVGIQKKIGLWLVVFLLILTTGCGQNQQQLGQSESGKNQPGQTPESNTTGTEPKTGGVLTVGMGADLTKLDLHTSTVLSDRIPLLHVQEMLVTIDENMTIIPMLAKDWKEDKEAKTVTFTLRQGVTFHNKKELKAEDVKYSLDRFRTEAPRKAEFSMVKSIDTPDDYTVVFHLDGASDVFLGSLVNPFNPAVIMPKGLAEEQGGKVTTPIGTGPFMFEKWDQGKELVLKRFPDYKPGEGSMSGLGGEKKAYLDEVVFKPISDPTVRMTALETGEIDIAIDVLPKDAQYIKDKPGLVMAQTPSLNWGMLQFGMKKPPFDNPKMREAVAYAINKQEIVDIATWGMGEVAPSPVFPSTWWYSDAHANDIKQDVEKAKQLVKEAGYNGETIKIATSKAYDHHEKTAIVLQKQLKDIGLNVEVEVFEWASFISGPWTTGDYHLLNGHITPRPDPNQIYYAYLHSSSSYNGYNSAEMDKLLDLGISSTEKEKRKEIYGQVQELLRKDLPFESLYYYPVIEAHQSYVKGYSAWSAGYPRLWNVWLDKQ
ncbi:diguanylate phosphodiesterase [Brevibacillus reuszeri]|uniref:ABC transporter substrate-binding protein n=1 Tax=Brevibacillus reuszeri TaxID=54915 RepID=UPI001B1A79C6|nr:ABC transporter substrate-binding protein [Brevibacillus reuszeri]GIO05436.1 diguanylate phosphodiesterase [Brevibacillus reuszeri]